MAITITRGTTPSITIHVAEDIDLSNASEIWVTLKQSPKTINKTLSDSQMTVADHTITVTYTQSETLTLLPDKGGQMQIRLLMNNGTALASQVERVSVNDVVMGGVIA